MPASNLTFKPALILYREIIVVQDVFHLPILSHYGLWVAEDEVIHASKDLKKAVSTSFQDFASGCRVSRSDYSNLVSNPDLAIQRAREAVGRWTYKFDDKNCEAFVLWCATGKETPGLQIGLAKLVGAAFGMPVQTNGPKPQRVDASMKSLSKLQETLDRNAKERQEKWERQMKEQKERSDQLWKRTQKQLDKLKSTS